MGAEYKKVGATMQAGACRQDGPTVGRSDGRLQRSELVCLGRPSGRLSVAPSVSPRFRRPRCRFPACECRVQPAPSFFQLPAELARAPRAVRREIERRILQRRADRLDPLLPGRYIRLGLRDRALGPAPIGVPAIPLGRRRAPALLPILDLPQRLLLRRSYRRRVGALAAGGLPLFKRAGELGAPRLVQDPHPRRQRAQQRPFVTHQQYRAIVLGDGILQGRPSVPRDDKGKLTDWTDVRQLDYKNPAVRREMIATMQYW